MLSLMVVVVVVPKIKKSKDQGILLIQTKEGVISTEMLEKALPN